MRISEVPYGVVTVLLVEHAFQQAFPTNFIQGMELFLYANEISQQILVGNANVVCPIVGVRSQDRQYLQNWQKQGSAELIWLLGRPKSSTSQLILQIHRFAKKIVWPFSLELGSDEYVLEEVRRKWPTAKNIDQIQECFRQQLLVEDAFSQEVRMFVGRDGSKLRLYGVNIVVDVALEDGLLKIVRIHSKGKNGGLSQNTESSSGRTNGKGNTESTFRSRSNKDVGIALVQTDLRVCELRFMVKLPETVTHYIEQTLYGEKYLHLWQEYNDLELLALSNRAKRFGYFGYSDWYIKDGRYHFILLEYPDLADRLDRLYAEEDLELECHENSEQINFYNSDWSQVFAHSPFVGKLIPSGDAENKKIVLDPIGEDDTDSNIPPKKGYLLYSLFGDYRRLERRRRAESAILNGTCPMPQLASILEGKKFPHSLWQQVLPTSAKLSTKFPNLNPTQQEAIRIAINTPDIALIQGPPGTGKTTVISAILNRLAEIGENTEGVSNLALLTSYQHEAVLNAADRVEIFGIPAMKVGQKHGNLLHKESRKRAWAWAKEKIEKISLEKKKVALPSNYIRLQDLVRSYVLEPDIFDIVVVLDEVYELSSRWLSGTMRDRLQAFKIRLQHGLSIMPEENIFLHHKLVSTVKDLPTAREAFRQSGVLKIGKFLERAKSNNILDIHEINFLEDLVANPRIEGISELKTIKQNILKRLDLKKAQTQQKVGLEIQKLLTDVLESVTEELLHTNHAQYMILQNYLNDLQHDISGVEESLFEYTAVLAATCQQAASKKICSLKDSDLRYDTVIVDEAARANPLDLFIPMSQAKRRIILVGDHRQLPQMLEPDVENMPDMQISEEIKKLWHESLFERLFYMMKEYEQHDGICRTITLDTQYRMHPVLGSFVSRNFYEIHGERSIQSAPQNNSLPHNFSCYKDSAGEKVAVWIDTPLSMGMEKRGQSKARIVEATRIAQELPKLMEANPQLSFGIISFYSAQIKEIQRQLLSRGILVQNSEGIFEIHPNWNYVQGNGKFAERLRIGTVDAFQGREFDVVILSMTRSNSYPCNSESDLCRKYGHLMLPNRLCVAMSRQKRLLIVVGDSGMLRPSPAQEVIRPLVEFYKLCEGSHGCIVI